MIIGGTRRNGRRGEQIRALMGEWDINSIPKSMDLAILQYDTMHDNQYKKWG
jgi:hypothetical protein